MVRECSLNYQTIKYYLHTVDYLLNRFNGWLIQEDCHNLIAPLFAVVHLVLTVLFINY